VGRGGMILKGRGTLLALPLKGLVRTCRVNCGGVLFVGWIKLMVFLDENRLDLNVLFAGKFGLKYAVLFRWWNWRFLLGFNGTVFEKLRLEYLKFKQLITG
jgi:hypothetical protein